MSFYNFYLPTVFSAFKKQKLAVENHFSRFHFIHSTFFDDWKLLIFAFKKQNYRKVENDHMSNETFWAIFKHCVTPSFFSVCAFNAIFDMCWLDCNEHVRSKKINRNSITDLISISRMTYLCTLCFYFFAVHSQKVNSSNIWIFYIRRLYF